MVYAGGNERGWALDDGGPVKHRRAEPEERSRGPPSRAARGFHAVSLHGGDRSVFTSYARFRG